MKNPKDKMPQREIGALEYIVYCFALLLVLAGIMLLLGTVFCILLYIIKYIVTYKVFLGIYKVTLSKPCILWFNKILT